MEDRHHQSILSSQILPVIIFQVLSLLLLQDLNYNQPQNKIPGIEKVFLAQSGKAVQRTITTGRQTEQLCEVLAGLKEGDEVVLQPGNLQPGQPLAIVR